MKEKKSCVVIKKSIYMYYVKKMNLFGVFLEKKKTSNDANATGLKEKEGMNIENLQLYGTRMTTFMIYLPLTHFFRSCRFS